MGHRGGAECVVIYLLGEARKHRKLTSSYSLESFGLKGDPWGTDSYSWAQPTGLPGEQS